MERYEVLEMEIVVFDSEDVIATSICDSDGGDICVAVNEAGPNS